MTTAGDAPNPIDALRPRRRRTVLAAAGALLATAIVAGASGALAGSQTFTDVPESHPFSAEIERIAAAGITTGNPDGTYRPGATVSRGAMAAFMARGFSSVSHGTRNILAAVELPDDGTPVGVTTIEVDAGATGGGEGYVVLSGNASFYTFGGECTCQVAATVRDAEGNHASASAIGPIGEGTDSTGAQLGNLAFTGVLPLPADTTGSYTLEVFLADPLGIEEIFAIGDLTAIYVPFLGDEVLEVAPAP